MTYESNTNTKVSVGTNNEPNVSTPSIGSASMLVQLNISTWAGRKLDKNASQDVTADNYADAGTANVNKKLLGNCDELRAVQKFAANTRNVHYSMTMPWSDTGQRLLPTAQYFKYHQTMTELQDEHTRMVQAFIDTYDWAISQAQARLGYLFSPDDYPSAMNMPDKFSFRFSYIPLPDVGDFRIDIGNEGNEIVREHYQSYYATQLTNAMNDVWQRAYKVLTKMSERLDYAIGTKEGRFKDSLISNVVDLVDLLDVCNVSGNSQMSAMRMKLDDALRGVTPEALREDGYLRAETKTAVDNVIKSLPSIDM